MAKKSPAAKPAFRVVRISDQTRNTFKSMRDVGGLKNHEALERLIMLNLPQLVEGLAALGISKTAAKGKVRPMRLPFTADAVSVLKGASDQTGLPQTLLLKVCLATAEPTKRGRKSRQS
jgi:hypothetical protein